MEVDEEFDQISDLAHWMAAHARLKNEFKEDEKYHNLMTWLQYEHCGNNTITLLFPNLSHNVQSSLAQV